MASETVDATPGSNPATARAGSAQKAKDFAAQTESKVRTQVKDVTKQMLSRVNDAADSASVMVNKVRDKIEAYADKATDKINASASDIQQNLTRSLKFPGSSEAVNSSDQPAPEGSNNGAPAFPLSIFTWCSSLCGGSKDGGSRGLDAASLQSNELFRNAAGQMSAAIGEASKKFEEQAQEAKKAAEAQLDGVAKETADQIHAIAKKTAPTDS